MFLKDKYLASGAFQKFKARLVAGGNQQDKGFYEDLSLPTVDTSSLLATTAVAAAGGRKVYQYRGCVLLHRYGAQWSRRSHET